MYLVKKTPKCLFWGKPYVTLVYVSNKALSCLLRVCNNMSKKQTINYIIPTRKNTACKPWVQQYATDV